MRRKIGKEETVEKLQDSQINEVIVYSKTDLLLFLLSTVARKRSAVNGYT